MLDPAFERYFAWLSERDAKSRKDLLDYLAENETQIDQAFLHLDEVNRYSWHDDLLETDEWELTRFIDQAIHPAYLRVLEAVHHPFLRLPAFFSRKDRDKGVDGLDLRSTVGELDGGSLKPILRGYRHVVRNAIAHGGVAFGTQELVYTDKKGNTEELGLSAVVEMLDNVVDDANAMALALSVFMMTRTAKGYVFPRQLLIAKLRAETDAPWWDIIGCTPAQTVDGTQLVVHARARSYDKRKILWSLFQSGVLAERYAPGFGRYFFKVRSDEAWPGFAAFDGQELRRLRVNQSSVDDYTGVLENDLIFYKPRRPTIRFLSAIGTALLLLRINWALQVEEMRKQRGIPCILPRNVKIHRNSWGYALRGDVWIDTDVDRDTVRRLKKRLVKMVRREAKKRLSRGHILRYLPAAFVQISIYQRNYRRRRLASYGLGRDLVGTIRFQRLKRIKSPDIFGSTVEQNGRWRLAWNREWLDAGAG